ncbi:hypothetical protein CPLU01_08994 [Colletotrichum plurivorum]|uniref:Uncharacterized protein n=1 Tax=Colletotrichum plurivorum TaxID=2175906 RepID=A0A8H6NBV3_9PEZI|nr:hypothetical protein CPLU01_08994 [Colletotrichum plurivorum]
MACPPPGLRIDAHGQQSDRPHRFDEISYEPLTAFVGNTVQLSSDGPGSKPADGVGQRVRDGGMAPALPLLRRNGYRPWLVLTQCGLCQQPGKLVTHNGGQMFNRCSPAGAGVGAGRSRWAVMMEESPKIMKAVGSGGTAANPGRARANLPRRAVIGKWAGP